MEFNELKPIYKQIIDSMCERVLNSTWQEESRVPSVREIAAELGVNPNTVMRAYEFLQNNDIIYNKRGIGNFVCTNARTKVMKMRKDEFINTQLPSFFKHIEILEISWNEITELYNNQKNNHTT